MYTNVCPGCKNKFSSENKYIENDSELHGDCIPRKISKHISKGKKRTRTSTPIKDMEKVALTKFSDSVSDFFYQTWKSGLDGNEAVNIPELQLDQLPQPQQQMEQEEQQLQQPMEQEQLQQMQQFHLLQEQPQVIQLVQPNMNPQSVFNVVFVNTVIVQPIVQQQMVLLPDGTYGVLPTVLQFQTFTS